jgi:RNA 2',3'-cyclic 3'-phosphodiesterase
MQRRVFITINLPPEVKKRLTQKSEKWADLPVRWNREDNLHITLAFLGYVDDTDLPKICEAVGEAAKKSEVFEIFLNKIIIGPSAERPRMVWAVGEKSRELKNLVERIEKQLGIFTSNKKEFRPHITLGRIRKENGIIFPPRLKLTKKLILSFPLKALRS